MGRFENLREDFARVAEEIGASELELPEVSWARSWDRGSRHYRNFYDERLKNLVQRRYEKDVERSATRSEHRDDRPSRLIAFLIQCGLLAEL